MADSKKTVEIVLKVVDQAGKQLQAMAASLKKVSTEEEKAGKAAKQFDQAQSKVAKSAEAVGKKAGKASTDVNKLAASENKAATSSKKLANDAKKAATQVDKLGKQASQTGKEVHDMSQDMMGGLGSMMANIGTIVTTVASIGLPVIVFADFERKMAEVGAVANATGDQLDSLSQQAIDLGSSTEFSARQVAEGMKFLSMAGFTVAQTSEAIAGVLDLALVGSMELGDAADIATNILTGFGKEVSELAATNDVLVATFTNTNSTLSELGTALSYVGPIASGLGGDFNDLTATIGLLHNAGLKGTMAGTALRGVLSKLFNPTKEEAEQMAVLSDRLGGVGLQIQKTNGDFVGFESLLRQLEGAGITAAEALKLFGQRAGPGIAALLNQGSEALGEMTNKLDESTGLTEKLAEQMGDNLKGSFKQMTSAAEGFMIRVGSKLAPTIQSMVEAVTSLLTVLNDWADAHPQLTTLIIKTAGAVAALATAVAAFNLSKSFLMFASGSMGFGKTIAGLASLTAMFKPLGMAAASTGMIIKAALWEVTLILGALTAGFAIGRAVSNFITGASRMQSALHKTANAATEAKEKLKEFADFKPAKREEIVWFDKESLVEYHDELKGAAQYQEAVIAELTAKSQMEGFWGGLTDEAKVAQEALGKAKLKYIDMIDAVNEYNEAVKNGPTGLDIAMAVSDEAVGRVADYKKEIVDLGQNFTTLEKEASTAWKDIQKAGTHSLEEQQKAIGNWAGVYKTKLDSMSVETSSTFDQVRQNIKEALENSADPNVINKLGSALKDAARKGAQAYQAMGDKIRTVVDSIAAKEADLLSSIEQITGRMTSIHENAASRRIAIEQESMDTTQKYNDNKLKAEEALTKARELSAQAGLAEGDEKEKLLAAANKENEKALSYSDKLRASEKDGITAAQSKADRLAIIQGYEEQSIANEEELLNGLEKELATWSKIKGEVTQVKDLIDKMVSQLNDGLKIDLKADGAIAQLDAVVHKMKGVSGEGLQIDLNTDTLGSQVDNAKDKVGELKEVIKKIDGVWTNVWENASDSAEDSLSGLNDDLEEAVPDDAEVNIKFTGSGSETLPISDKVAAIKAELGSIGGAEALVLDVDFKQAIEGFDAIKDSSEDSKPTIDKMQAAVRQLVVELSQLHDVVINISLKYFGYEQLSKLISKIALLKDKTITITTKYVTKRAGGGFIDDPAHYADGGSVFKRLATPFIQRGGGTKDDVPAMLMRGEFVLRQSAVNKYGQKFLHMLNAGLLPSIPGFKDGGIVSNMLGSAQQGLRQAELSINPNAPFKQGDTVYNINAPSFHAGLGKQASSFKTPQGKARSTNMLSLFSKLIPKLRQGGGTNLMADFNVEKNLMIAMYDADIQNAKDTGDEEVAFALEMEKIQLEELAAALAITLEQIRLDYEQEMLDLTNDLDEYKQDVSEQVIDAEISYQKALTDLTRERSSMEREYINEKRDLERDRAKLQKRRDFERAFERQARQYGGTVSSTPTKAQVELSRLGEQLTSLETDYKQDTDGLDTETKDALFEKDQTQARAQKGLARTESRTNRTASVLERKELTELGSEENEVKYETQKIQAETAFSVKKTTNQTTFDIKKLELELQLELLKLRQQYDSMMQAERDTATQTTATPTPQQLGIKYWLNKGGWVGYPKGKKRKEDSVMAMLTPGEFVVKEDAVQHYGADFIEALNNKEVNPEYSDFPSFLDKPQMVNVPTNVDGTTYHINAPSFHKNLADRSHKLQSALGKQSAHKMVSIFADAVPHLAEGGGIGDAEAQLTFEIDNVTSEYTENINDARIRGDNDLVYILEMERIELQMIAEELQYTLDTLLMERDFALQEAELEQQSDLDEAQFEYDEDLLDLEQNRIDARYDMEGRIADYQSRIGAARSAKAQADAQNRANRSAGRGNAAMIRDRINKLSGNNLWVGMAPSGWKTGQHWLDSTRRNMKIRNKAEILALEQELRQLNTSNESKTQQDTGRYTSEISSYQSGIASTQAKYNRMVAMYAKQEENTHVRKERQDILTNSKYDFGVTRSERQYEFGTNKATQTAAIDSIKITTKAQKEYSDREQEMTHDIQLLEIELAKAIFDLKKDYSKAGDFGITHFLNKGGDVGYPAGAVRGVDSIRAMLTPGEFVMKESVVRKFGKGFFDKLNNFTLPKLPHMRFAEGGLVPGADINESVSDKLLGTVNLSIGGNKYPATMNRNIAKNLVKEFKNMGLSIA